MARRGSPRFQPGVSYRMLCGVRADGILAVCLVKQLRRQARHAGCELGRMTSVRLLPLALALAVAFVVAAILALAWHR